MANKTILEEFVIKLGYELSDAQKLKLKAFSDSLDNVAKKSAIIVGSIAAAGTAFATFVGYVAGAVRSNSEFAESIDMSYENLQRLGYAAEASGDSFENMKGSLGSLRKIQQEFSLGNDSNAETLGRLGISVLDSAGKFRKLEDIYLDLADAGQKMSKEGRKGEFGILAQQLGIGSPQQILMLQKGREHIKGLMSEANVVSGKSAENATKFRDSLTKLCDMFKIITNILLESVAPVFEELVINVKEFVEENRELIKLRLRELFQGIANILKLLWEVAKPFLPIIIGITAALAQMVSWLLQTKPALYTLVTLFGAIAVSKFVIFIMQAVLWCKNLLTVFGGMRTALQFLFVGNPFGWIAIAVSGLFW